MFTKGKFLRRIATTIVSVGALAAPAAASATTRYAGVGGSTTDLNCTDPAHPCDLYHIIQSVGPAGDEVVVAPGSYTYPFAINIPRGLNIHGAAGQPRPVLNLGGLSNSTIFGAVTLRYLDVELGAGAFEFGGGTVEQVTIQGGDNTCRLGGPIVFRDDVCANTTGGGSAIEIDSNGGTEQLDLRNVTAITNFNGGSAIHVGTQAAGGSIMVNLFNTIAQVGGPKGVDISATTIGGGGSVTVNTNHSNYATSVPSGPGASINNSITDTHTAPAFVPGSDREEASSSATIGKGATQAENGDFDFEGDLRSVGGVTDIGADQFVARPEVSAVSAAGTGTVATVHAALDTSGSPTTYSVQYGATSAYGASTAPSSLPASAGPQQVAVALSGLTPGATYHYRVVASGDGGSADSGDLVFTEARVPVVAPPPVGPPRLGSLGFTRSRFAVVSRAHRHGGTRITYTDSARARTTFTVSRRLPGRRARFVVVGSFTHTDVAGVNRISFSGRLRGHALRAGHYRIVAVPVSSTGKRGGARQHDFVVVG